MNQRANSSHLDRIDVLRAAAILMVVCFHFLPSITGQYEFGWDGLWRNVHDVQTSFIWFLYPLTLGWSGVSLFFVISGFCIHYSFLKHEAGSSRKSFLRQFFWKRFWRIYPPYLITLVVFFLLTFRHPEAETGANNFWLHLLLVHNLAAGAFNGINPSFWSLAVEMQFYLLFPVVLILRKKIGIRNTFWFFAAVSAICRITALFLQDWSQPPSQYLWDFTLTLFVDWLLGAWLAEKWLSGERLFNASSGMVLLLGILAVALTWNKITAAFLGFTAFSLWYAALMEWYLFSGKSLGGLEKMLVPVGLCSYSIYLWHQPLLGRVLYWLHRVGLPQTHAYTLAALPLVILAMVALGLISYKLIELTGISLGRRLYRKRFAD
jgi:peptidoglycan/LPS O-acetylase OafA/YrhL